MVVFVFVGNFKCILPLGCLGMQTYLFRQKVKENVHVSTHGRYVKVSLVIGLLIINLGSPEDKFFDTLVASI